MSTARWAKMVQKVERPDDWGVPVVSSSDVVTLLARQHAAMVRLVKKIKAENIALYEQETDTRLIDCWRSRIAGLNDVLSALAKQGRKKK